MSPRVCLRSHQRISHRVWNRLQSPWSPCRPAEDMAWNAVFLRGGIYSFFWSLMRDNAVVKGSYVGSVHSTIPNPRSTGTATHHRACRTQVELVLNAEFKGFGIQLQVLWLSTHMLPTFLGRFWVSSEQTQCFGTVMTLRVMDELVESPVDSGLGQVWFWFQVL